MLGTLSSHLQALLSPDRTLSARDLPQTYTRAMLGRCNHGLTWTLPYIAETKALPNS